MFSTTTRINIIKLAYWLIVIIGLLLAYQQSWNCDDAYISFRYALNAIRGEGLVFNPGEYVDGYTNFLWTVALIPAMAAGIAPETAAGTLGLFSLTVLFLAVIYFLRKEDTNLNRPDSAARFVLYGLPAFLPGLAMHKHFQIFATSGLETMFFTLMLTIGILTFLSTNRQYSYIFFTVAAMTRPDALLVYGLTALYELILIYRRKAGDNGSLWNYLLSAHSPFLFIFLPYWLIRWHYYGFFWPNTFYAKSAADPYPLQGLHYLFSYFSSYWIFLLLPLLKLYNSLRSSPQLRQQSSSSLKPTKGNLSFTNPGGYTWLILLSWLTYIAWVGGDFMFARFLIPITPLIYLMLSRELIIAMNFTECRLPGRFAVTPALITTIILLLGTLLRYDPYAGSNNLIIRGIADEYHFYRPREMRRVIREIKPLSKNIRESQAVFAFYGAQAFIIYHLDPVVAIESSTGLTDRFIATQKLKRRGRIAHEKRAPFDYLVRRGVNISLRAPPPAGKRSQNIINIPGLYEKAEIINYEPTIFERLKVIPGVEFNFRDN